MATSKHQVILATDLKPGNLFKIAWVHPDLCIDKNERTGYALPVVDENSGKQFELLSSADEFMILSVGQESTVPNKVQLQIIITSRDTPVIGRIRPEITFVENKFIRVL